MGLASKDDGTMMTASDPITSNSTCSAGSSDDDDTVTIASNALISTFGGGVGSGAVMTTNSVADADSDGT